VERYLAGSGGDFAHFADRFVNTIPMSILGQNAPDILWANSGDDFLDGGNHNDHLDGGPGNDVIFGGTGDDHITMGYDNGVDSVFGGTGPDDMSVNALASQITILPAANVGFEFDIYYLGNWIAEITQVEEFLTLDSSIDLTVCVSGVCDLCGNDVLNGGEECDDGNFTNGDGCAFDCTLEL
jgi:cysteine-rich repeat protein